MPLLLQNSGKARAGWCRGFAACDLVSTSFPGPFPWLGDPSQGKGPGNEVALVPNTEDCSQDIHDTLFLFFFLIALSAAVTMLSQMYCVSMTWWLMRPMIETRVNNLINANNGFQWFFHALLNFTLGQRCTYGSVLGKFAVVYARTRFFNILKSLKSRNRKCACFSLFRNLITRLHLKFFPILHFVDRDRQPLYSN